MTKQLYPERRGEIIAPDLRDAYLMGETVATQLRTGSVFRGALPEGAARGYSGDRLHHFINGFLDAVRRRWPTGVVIDREGRIGAD